LLVAAQKADRLPAAVLITAQSVVDQRDSQISDCTAALVNPDEDLARRTHGGQRLIEGRVQHKQFI
jgi:hypothetical protein